MLEMYCDAWNRGELDAIFVLFAEDDGTTERVAT